MSVSYHCPHLDAPHAPYPPAYPSSAFSSHPLDRLYFCEECDAIRCDQCVVVEAASYFCPNCLFDVPSANVKADKNRCARSCFNCPVCSTFLAVQAEETVATSSSAAETPSSYLLVCPGCRWDSRRVNWKFEKPTGLAAQLQKMYKRPDAAQAELDSIRGHLEGYMASTAPPKTPARTPKTNTSRHISHLTQMAAKALHRPLPSRAMPPPRMRTISGLSAGTEKNAPREKFGWDELEEYESKLSWRSEVEDIDALDRLRTSSGGQFDEKTMWSTSLADPSDHDVYPQRVKLQTKQTKRCPHPNCRHLLIQPDTKSVRMKIKMVARSYLPEMEIGRRRKRTISGELTNTEGLNQEELEKQRRERRRTKLAGPDESQELSAPIEVGTVYSYQIAFVNPLYDPIQIRLTPAGQPRNAPPPAARVHVPTPHFTVDAMHDAWAYDEAEEEEDPFVSAVEGSTDFTSQSEDSRDTVGKRSRLSLTATGTLRERQKRTREATVEKKANTSKVGLDVEILPNATGRIAFDLEVRYTYRAEDPAGVAEAEGARDHGKKERGREAYKTFTFWVRVNLGEVLDRPVHA